MEALAVFGENHENIDPRKYNEGDVESTSDDVEFRQEHRDGETKSGDAESYQNDHPVAVEKRPHETDAIPDFIDDSNPHQALSDRLSVFGEHGQID